MAKQVVERHPEAVYLDTYSLFSDRDGKYTRTVDVDGRTQVVRTDDGVHFTAAGGDLIARAAFDILDARCKVTAQAVKTAPKTIILTPGSQGAPGVPATTTLPPSSTTTLAPVTTRATTTLPPSTEPPATTEPPTTTTEPPSSTTTATTTKP